MRSQLCGCFQLLPAGPLEFKLKRRALDHQFHNLLYAAINPNHNTAVLLRKNQGNLGGGIAAHPESGQLSITSNSPHPGNFRCGGRLKTVSVVIAEGKINILLGISFSTGFTRCSFQPLFSYKLGVQIPHTEYEQWNAGSNQCHYPTWRPARIQARSGAASVDNKYQCHRKGHKNHRRHWMNIVHAHQVRKQHCEIEWGSDTGKEVVPPLSRIAEDDVIDQIIMGNNDCKECKSYRRRDDSDSLSQSASGSLEGGSHPHHQNPQDSHQRSGCGRMATAPACQRIGNQIRQKNEDHCPRRRKSANHQEQAGYSE